MKKQAAPKVWKPTKVKYSTAKIYDNPSMWGGKIGDAIVWTRDIWASIPHVDGAFVWVNRWEKKPAQKSILDLAADELQKADDANPYEGKWGAIEPTAAEIICKKYTWIERWEADPKKRMYKSTIQNGKTNRRAELAALNGLNVTAEFQ